LSEKATIPAQRALRARHDTQTRLTMTRAQP